MTRGYISTEKEVWEINASDTAVSIIQNKLIFLPLSVLLLFMQLKCFK